MVNKFSVSLNLFLEKYRFPKFIYPGSKSGFNAIAYGYRVTADSQYNDDGENQGFFGEILVRLPGGQFELLKFNAETKKMNISTDWIIVGNTGYTCQFYITNLYNIKIEIFSLYIV